MALSRILDFFRDEYRHIIIKKMEQSKAELEYDISRLEPIMQKNDVFWIEWTEKKYLLARLESKLNSVKERWG